MSKGVKIGLECLDGLRELKAGGGIVCYPRKKPATKTVLGRARRVA